MKVLAEYKTISRLERFQRRKLIWNSDHTKEVSPNNARDIKTSLKLIIAFSLRSCFFHQQITSNVNFFVLNLLFQFIQKYFKATAYVKIASKIYRSVSNKISSTESIKLKCKKLGEKNGGLKQ